MAKRARHLARRLADDYVTWGQMMAFNRRTVTAYRRSLEEVKQQIANVDFNGTLGRLREIMPELERVARVMREEDGYNAEKKRRADQRRERWGWLMAPAGLIRAGAIAAVAAVAGVIAAKFI